MEKNHTECNYTVKELLVGLAMHIADLALHVMVVIFALGCMTGYFTF